jgi:2-methylcitrate dehydratase PrpD
VSQDLDKLATFLAAARLDEVAAEDLDHSRLVIADCIAAMVAGSLEPEITALASHPTTPGPASVLGTSLRTTPERAAFLNGTAGTVLEVDEGHRFCRGHPGIHVLPAALAYAEGQGKSGAELLLAVLLGYEVAVRVGRAAELRPAMHPHGTWGTLGAAVAVAKLAGADAGAFRRSLEVAAPLCLGTSVGTMLEGGTVRNSFAGFAGRTGLQVQELVEAGFVGESDALGAVFGRVLSERWRPEILSAGLGGSWEIRRNYFKRHACCRYNHAALDALAAIGRQQPLEAAAIAAIEVETYGLAAALDEARPRNAMASRFSIPFALATSIVSGASGTAAFAAEKFSDPAILELAARISLTEDPAMTAAEPERRPARVTVVWQGGGRRTESVENARGEPELPFAADELEEKYFELTARAWSRDQAAQVHGDVLALETLGDVRRLIPRQ